MKKFYNNFSLYIDSFRLDGVKRIVHLRKENVEGGNVTVNEYELRRVSKDELVEIRGKKSNQAYFILSQNHKFYIAEVPSDISFLSKRIVKTKEHLCKDCHKLSAAIDGCSKVFDPPLYTYANFEGGKSKNDVYSSCRIEKYDHILYGYETIGTKCDCFVVLECTNFERIVEKKPEVVPKKKYKSVW